MEEYIESYCWIQNTYWVPMYENIPDDHTARESIISLLLLLLLQKQASIDVVDSSVYCNHLIFLIAMIAKEFYNEDLKSIQWNLRTYHTLLYAKSVSFRFYPKELNNLMKIYLLKTKTLNSAQ